jgi:hypothetical protein
MNKGRIVSIPAGLLEAIFEAAKRLYRREVILLLKGKGARDKSLSLTSLFHHSRRMATASLVSELICFPLIFPSL